jgi:hypothetical protein
MTRIRHNKKRQQSPVKAIHLMPLFSLLLFSGCASTVCMESKRNLQRFDGGDRPVFVTNPELSQEHELLRASAIYPLARHPDGARRLTLHPLRQYARCGNPLMLSGLTLGIIPGILPGERVFEYELETDGVMESYTHHLPVYERISVWEWLVRDNDDKVLAEALAWAVRQERPTQFSASNGSRPIGSERSSTLSASDSASDSRR